MRFERLSQLHYALKTLAYTMIDLLHYCRSRSPTETFVSSSAYRAVIPFAHLCGNLRATAHIITSHASPQPFLPIPSARQTALRRV